MLSNIDFLTNIVQFLIFETNINRHQRISTHAVVEVMTNLYCDALHDDDVITYELLC